MALAGSCLIGHYARVGVGGKDGHEGIRQPEFRNRGWRAGNAVVSLLARVGIGPIHLLTTRGYRSGRPHTVPAVPVDFDGKGWLVAPCGRATREYAIREVSQDEAGPVLKRYVAVAGKTRPYFTATKDAPVEDFVAEADRHPVSNSSC